MAANETSLWSKAGAAAKLAPRAGLDPKAIEILKPDHSPGQFVETLLAFEMPADGIKLIPFTMPRREVMWWAAQCIKAVPQLSDAKTVSAVDAVEKWCANPTDELRRAAQTAAEAADLGTPGGCAAMAVFLCEGSLAPPEFAAVEAPPDVGLSMAGSSVILAAVADDPEDASPRYVTFVQLAAAVANGLNCWAGAKAPKVTAASPSPSSAKDFPPYPQPKGRTQ